MTDGHRMRGFGYMAVPAECSVNKTIQQKGKIMKFIDGNWLPAKNFELGYSCNIFDYDL